MLIFLLSLCFAQDPSTITTNTEIVVPPDTTKAEQVASAAEPTVRYLVEELKNAVVAGLPLAQESLTIVLNQISYAGIGFLIFDIGWLILSIVGMYQAKKLWLYAQTVTNHKNEAVEFLWSGLIFFISLVSLIACLSSTPDDLLMATAPIVWSLQQM